MTRRILYLFDPLCGWCYGASDKLARLDGQSGIIVTPMPTGLFSGHAAPRMDDAFAAHAWANDQRIARLTGQVFSDAYRSRILGDRTARMDSGPATLALTAVALTDPARQIAALRAIQTARYVEGRDVTSTDVLGQILQDLSLDAAAALFQAADQPLQDAHRDRIAAARDLLRRFGVTGVPTFILEDAQGQRLIPSDAVLNGAGLFADLPGT